MSQKDGLGEKMRKRREIMIEKTEKEGVKVRKWVGGKPRGGVVSWKDEQGVDKQVRLGIFIKKHLLATHGDHIQSTWKAYKKAVKGQGKKYNPGSYMNMKGYFWMAKKLGLIKPTNIKRKAKLKRGQKIIVEPVVYHIENSVDDAWQHLRKNYNELIKKTRGV